MLVVSASIFRPSRRPIPYYTVRASRISYHRRSLCAGREGPEAVSMTGIGFVSVISALLSRNDYRAPCSRMSTGALLDNCPSLLASY